MPSEVPTLRTERLLLRPLTLDDLPDLARLYGDPEVMDIRKIGVQDLDGTRNQLRQIVDHWHRHGFGLFAVIELASGLPVGECGLRYLEDGKTVELSYGLVTESWGKGYATEAAAAVLSFGFNTLGLDAIVAIAAGHNLASHAVMRKLGMRRDPADQLAEDVKIVRYRIENKEFLPVYLAETGRVKMKLYDLTPAPNARRVRIYLAEKGLDIPKVEMDIAKGENRTPEYLARNPLGKMPVLELDDGTCIAESMAICRYLEELHPEPPMFGRTALERAQVEMWNRRMELELLILTIHVFVHAHAFWKGRVEQNADWGAACRAQVLDRFTWLDRELAGREFVATGDYTVADITAQCAVLLGKANDLRVPPGLENLTGWWDRVSGRPSARA